MSDTRERVALDRIRLLLATEFPEVPPDRVASVVEDAVAGLAQTAVRDFIPVLVERRARAQLANLAL